MKIKKSLLSVLLASVISATLVGCGSNTDSQQNENNSAQVEQNQNSKPKAAEKKDNSAGKTETSRVGSRTTLKSMKNLSIEQTQGPIKAKITDIQMGKLETNESSKKLFDDKDIVYFVTIAMEVENTSGDTVAVYPDQGTLVTDTKEQVEANKYYSSVLKKEIDTSIKKVEEVRRIAQLLSENSASYEKTLVVEKVNNLINKVPSYKELTDEKINELINLVKNDIEENNDWLQIYKFRKV